MHYVVLQVILKEKLWGTGSGNLTELEKTINAQAARATGSIRSPRPAAGARDLAAVTASRRPWCSKAFSNAGREQRRFREVEQQ